MSAASMMTGCAGGYAPDDYVPIAHVTENADVKWKSDLSSCYTEHASFIGTKPEYRMAINACMQSSGHAVDIAASTAQDEAREAALKKKRIDKAKKLSGY